MIKRILSIFFITALMISSMSFTVFAVADEYDAEVEGISIVPIFGQIDMGMNHEGGHDNGHDVGHNDGDIHGDAHHASSLLGPLGPQHAPQTDVAGNAINWIALGLSLLAMIGIAIGGKRQLGRFELHHTY